MTVSRETLPALLAYARRQFDRTDVPGQRQRAKALALPPGGDIERAAIQAESADPDDLERDAIRAEGASLVHTEDLTLPVGNKRRNNSTDSTPQRPKPLLKARNDKYGAPNRTAWLEDVASATALHREQRAKALEARSRELGIERRHDWQKSNRTATDRSKPQDHEPETSGWHETRARGKRELFERVDACSEATRYVKGTCRGGCGHTFTAKIGCASQMFCPDCRAQIAERTRQTFNRKRLGLLEVARRSGNLAKKKTAYRRGWRTFWFAENPDAQKVGGLSERFATFTIPHEGSARDRIKVIRKTYQRFWRTLADELRDGKPLEGRRSGVVLKAPPLRDLRARVNVQDVERGFRTKWDRKTQRHWSPDELSIWDLVAYFYVLEWTEGADKLGHPHLHIWLLLPFIKWQRLRAHWSSAYAHVMQKNPALVKGELGRMAASGEASPLLNIFVQRIKESDDVGHELVKYLTKDWSEDNTRRVAPEVFAEVYAELDGKRRRQTSAGLAHWELEKYRACPHCGYEHARQHWAFIELGSSFEEQCGKRKPPPLRLEPPPTETLVALEPATREEELRQVYEERKAEEWLHSIDRRLLAAKLDQALGRVR